MAGNPFDVPAEAPRRPTPAVRRWRRMGVGTLVYCALTLGFVGLRVSSEPLRVIVEDPLFAPLVAFYVVAVFPALAGLLGWPTARALHVAWAVPLIVLEGIDAVLTDSGSPLMEVVAFFCVQAPLFVAWPLFCLFVGLRGARSEA